MQSDNNIFGKSNLFQRVELNKINEMSTSISNLENRVQNIETNVNFLRNDMTILRSDINSIKDLMRELINKNNNNDRNLIRQ